MGIKEEVQKLRKEFRPMRKRIAMVENAWQSQKTRADRLEQKIQTLQQEKKVLKEENKKLNEEKQELQKENKHLKVILNKTQDHNEKLKGMIFKPNIKESKPETEKKKRGAQKGHKGNSRKKPKRINKRKRVYLSHCEDCKEKLKRSDSFYERIVEDIPFPTETTVTLYAIERQWCGNCQKEISATPSGTLKNFRFGVNLIVWILLHKYRMRLPLKKMKELLKEQYNLEITTGAIQNTLHCLKKKFGKKYQDFIKEIRKSKVKHADETGWRIEGENVWCWLFADEKTSIYTIEETRGKGVPKEMLGEHPQGVLVRDDYPAYKKLPMEQQSCWAHLLRVSHELSKKEKSSLEVKKLHNELSIMFSELSKIIQQPYIKTEREKFYKNYTKQLVLISNKTYISSDAKEIQTRITNQNINLITALRHSNIPLTNNHAERQIRPIVITRKISGGSRSNNGAQTHAVNMSIIQTTALRNKSVIRGLQKLLMSPNRKLVLEKAE